MTPEYKDLARKRYLLKPSGYLNPEDIGFDFRDWVSPYTKAANARGGIAIVLQDWGSVRGFDSLSDRARAEVRRIGRNPELLTNRRLDYLLMNTLGLRTQDVYVTNAFPYIKPGTMSANIPMIEMKRAILEFTLPELSLAQASKVIVCGAMVCSAINSVCAGSPWLNKLIKVPHPAARISLINHVDAWMALRKSL